MPTISNVAPFRRSLQPTLAEVAAPVTFADAAAAVGDLRATLMAKPLTAIVSQANLAPSGMRGLLAA